MFFNHLWNSKIVKKISIYLDQSSKSGTFVMNTKPTVQWFKKTFVSNDVTSKYWSTQMWNAIMLHCNFAQTVFGEADSLAAFARV